MLTEDTKPVPLISLALRDDPALQACLISDPAHVVPGSRGPHVARIQSALSLLEKASVIPASELRAEYYGSSTAAAVLEYKRKRQIINRAYQDAPDNIVGKMTIARLDEELATWERRPSDSRAVCRDCGCGGGADFERLQLPLTLGPSVAGGRKPGPIPTPKRPPVLTWRIARASVVFQVTDGAEKLGGAVGLLFGLFAKARQLMTPFGLDFAGAADNGIFPLIGPSVPDSTQVISGSPVSTFSVRAAAERVFPGRADTLRIIFCAFTEKDEATFGITDGGTVADWTFPKFCLINVRKANPDQGTVLHEMIHASRPQKMDHDTDGTSVFSENIGGRTRLPAEHADRVARAFYSTILS